MAERKRVLMLATAAALTDSFQAPAEKLALWSIRGCSDSSGDLRLDFGTRDTALVIVTHAQQQPFVAIVAVGDETAPVAARAASMLGLPFHTPKAADTCLDKRLLQRTLQSAGIAVTEGDEPQPDAGERITLECLMTHGRLRVLAATSRDGVKGSGQFGAGFRAALSDSIKRVIAVLGLQHGPVRVVILRWRDGVAICDVSCACVPDTRTTALRFSIPLVDQDITFEELVLRNALDLDTSRVLPNVPDI